MYYVLHCLYINYRLCFYCVHAHVPVHSEADPEEGPWGPLTPLLKLTLEG